MLFCVVVVGYVVLYRKMSPPLRTFSLRLDKVEGDKEQKE